MIVDEYFISGPAREASGARKRKREPSLHTFVWQNRIDIALALIYGEEVRVIALLASNCGPCDLFSKIHSSFCVNNTGRASNQIKRLVDKIQRARVQNVAPNTCHSRIYFAKILNIRMVDDICNPADIHDSPSIIGREGGGGRGWKKRNFKRSQDHPPYRRPNWRGNAKFTLHFVGSVRHGWQKNRIPAY